MILIKDRHNGNIISKAFVVIGKYDTYKGSTLDSTVAIESISRQGNMILIKDRH